MRYDSQNVRRQSPPSTSSLTGNAAIADRILFRQSARGIAVSSLLLLVVVAAMDYVSGDELVLDLLPDSGCP